MTGPLTPLGPADTIRIVTNDFMFTGGDGYTALAGGTNVLQPGDALLDMMYRTANGRLTAAEALGHREFVLTRLYESA